MDLITIDFETYYDSEYSLSKMTTEEYIRDRRFQVIGVSVKVNNGEAEWASGTHEELKAYLQTFSWDTSLYLAHNTLFDGAISSWVFDIHPLAYTDTLCIGRALHGVEVGGSLSALAQRYAVGDKGNEVVSAKGKRREDFTPEELARYGDYCINDVNLTYDLFKIMGRGFPKKELRLIDCTARMFTDPILDLELGLLEQHLDTIKTAKDDLLTSVGLDKAELMSNAKFAKALETLGVIPPTKISPKTGKTAFAFAKTDEGLKALAEHEDGRVQTLVAARLGLKSTLEETRTQRFIDISKRGLLPVPVKYYAAHTGRWGGYDKINLQNLPSRGPNGKVLKQSMIAPEGYSIVEADSSQIEARVLAWLADQDDLVRAFANGEDVYKKMASSIYDVPEEEITKDQRFVGKTTILGCFGADTRVLTGSGWKYIVDVLDTDTVWDGEEWVTHRGVIPQGVKRTLRFSGVDATLDHEILTEHGWREWSEVATNPSLFQSATSKANLPFSAGNNTSKPRAGQQDGTPLSGAVAGGRAVLTAITSRLGELLGVTPVASRRDATNGIGSMRPYCQTYNTGNAYSTVYPPAYLGAITPRARHTPTTEAGASQYTLHGVQTGGRFLGTCLRWMAGRYRNSILTGSTTPKGTRPVISGLPHVPPTQKTGEPWANCKRNSMTFDIVCAGPRNRFTIATNAGPVIAHNCGYGMGAPRFQEQLKSFGFGMELGEARRIIDIYRQVNGRITKLWRDAGDTIKHLANGDASSFGHGDLLAVDVQETGIRLPSGLLMRYTDLKGEQVEGRYEYTYKTRRGRTRIYGGKVIENVCQALARIIIGDQMLDIAQRYRVVLTVHDSIVCCVPDAEVEAVQEYVEERMRVAPIWAAGLPLDCESGVGKSYGDCE